MNRGLWKNYAAANRDNFLLIRKKQKREGKGKEKEGEGEGERRGKEEKEKEKTESHWGQTMSPSSWAKSPEGRAKIWREK